MFFVIRTHNAKGHYLQHVGLDSRLLYVMDCSVFTVHTMAFSLKDTKWFNHRKKSFQCFPTVIKYQIGLSCNVFCLGIWFKTLLSELLTWISFQKKAFSEFQFGIRTEFLTISEMAPNTFLPFCTMYLYKAAFSALMIDFKNQNISKLWKMLKMLYILQYQPFSQDSTVYVKVNM